MYPLWWPHQIATFNDMRHDHFGIITARAYARAVLGVVILSVCHTRGLLQNKMTHCRYFDTTRKGNHSATLVPTVVGGRRLLSEICTQSDPHPFEKRRLRQISAHNVSTVGDSKKISITTNIKSTTGFPTSHRGSAYVTPKCPKGWLKERFFRFLSKSKRLIVSSAVNLVRWSVSATSDGRLQC